jgi:hypothetical protein
MNASAYTSGAIHPKTFISFEVFFRTRIKINVNFFRMNNIDADLDKEGKIYQQQVSEYLDIFKMISYCLA